MSLPLVDGTPHVWLATCWLDGEPIVVAGASEADAQAQLAEYFADVDAGLDADIPADCRATGCECYSVPVRGA